MRPKDFVQCHMEGHTDSLISDQTYLLKVPRPCAYNFRFSEHGSGPGICILTSAPGDCMQERDTGIIKGKSRASFHFIWKNSFQHFLYGSSSGKETPLAFVCLKSLSLSFISGRQNLPDILFWQFFFLSAVWISYSTFSWPIRFLQRNPLIPYEGPLLSFSLVVFKILSVFDFW